MDVFVDDVTTPKTSQAVHITSHVTGLATSGPSWGFQSLGVILKELLIGNLTYRRSDILFRCKRISARNRMRTWSYPVTPEKIPSHNLLLSMYLFMSDCLKRLAEKSY